jgi:hypothetical protein
MSVPRTGPPLLDGRRRPGILSPGGVNLCRIPVVVTCEMTMRSPRKRIGAVARPAGLAIVALSLAACLSVRVERGVGNADRAFDKAFADISRLESSGRGRHARPHRLVVLVHDADEGELVRVSVPLWLVDAGLSLASRDEERGHDLDPADRYDLEWEAVKDLGRYGRGLLASVEEERARVLVWLR